MCLWKGREIEREKSEEIYKKGKTFYSFSVDYSILKAIPATPAQNMLKYKNYFEYLYF